MLYLGTALAAVFGMNSGQVYTAVEPVYYDARFKCTSPSVSTDFSFRYSGSQSESGTNKNETVLWDWTLGYIALKSYWPFSCHGSR